MKQNWIDRIFTEPPAAAAFAIFALSLATLAGAWFFEFVLKLPPCPLCLTQRIPYHIMIPLSLLLGIAALAHAPQKLVTVGFAAVMIAALCNVVLGAYHAGVEWQMWAGPSACTGSAFQLSGALDLNAHVVSCDHAAWRLFGISMAGYNAIISLGFAAAAFALLTRTETRA